MKTRMRLIAPIAGLGAASAIALVAGSALASGPDTHVGDPAVWGPPLAVYCTDPAAAEAAGYHVIDDPHPDAEGHFGGLLYGTPDADLILANGGNDIVYAGAGNDIVCGSFGNDDIFGEGGNDALFGDGHADLLKGGANSDYLDGGGQLDRCDGGNGDDAAAALCNTIAE